MIRVAIVAPAPVMRAGLRAMLSIDDIQAVVEAASLGDLDRPLSDIDVLVISGDSLLEGPATALENDQALAIVVLDDDNRAVPTLDKLPLRGWSIISLDAPAVELQAAVSAAAQGLVALPLASARSLLSSRQSVVTLEGEPLQEALTARESEVLQLISQGLPNKLIARQLQISEHTVKFHVSSIYTKLGASNRAEVVNKGARYGLITL